MKILTLLCLMSLSTYALDPTPQGVPGGRSELGAEDIGDPAFLDPRYQEESRLPLSEGEVTSQHTYESGPCGTLMSQFSERGSVRLGRGPAYQSALLKCRKLNPRFVPNEFSVRTYACRNNDSLQGTSTFAFFCGLPDSDTVCTRRRGISSASQDWNCGSMVK